MHGSLKHMVSCCCLLLLPSAAIAAGNTTSSSASSGGAVTREILDRRAERYDTAAWESIAVPAEYPKRYGQGVCWDPVHDQIYVYGGGVYGTDYDLADARKR